MFKFDPLTIASDLTPELYSDYCQFIYDRAGITLPDNKQTLVAGRITRRMRDLQLNSCQAYWEYVCGCEQEAQHLIDALTTNETRFFRERRHFDRLEQLAQAHSGIKPFRVWSAACSTGEEPYSSAMVLSETLGDKAWDIFATDINRQVLAHAEAGLYSMIAANLVPTELLHKYCLEGVNAHAGKFMVAPSLKSRIKFDQVNLNDTLPFDDLFDVVFLRNVLIYFDTNTISAVIGRIVQRIKPGGYLFIGHSENLRNVSPQLESVEPAVYRRIVKS